MKERFLGEFLTQIHPFRHLWRSAYFVGYAGLVDGAWILLGGRMVLSPKSIQSEVLRKVVDRPDFFMFVDELPMTELETVLRTTIETENLHMNLGGSTLRDIRLKAGENNSITWFQPVKFDRSAKDLLGFEGVGFQWTIRNNTQMAQIGATELLQRASEFLRLGSDVNGVEALAAQYTPGLPLNHFQFPQLQIVAPLPFELRYTHGRGVCLRIPGTANPLELRLKAFFGPPLPAVERPVSLKERPTGDGTCAITWDFEWPQNACYADIRLFYGDREIDAITVNRWKASATIRGAIDEYFDVEHEQLRKALRWQAGSKSSDQFELAVVRLLNLLGIPAVWYGKIVDSGRPDASAVIVAQNSKNTVLLIECTREKPAEKFSPLAERARQLSHSIKDDASVLALVFTSAHVIETDVATASEYGICLIGAEELTYLLELLTSTESTAQLVLQYLMQRTAVTVAQRFRRPW